MNRLHADTWHESAGVRLESAGMCRKPAVWGSVARIGCLQRKMPQKRPKMPRIGCLQRFSPTWSRFLPSRRKQPTQDISQPIPAIVLQAAGSRHIPADSRRTPADSCHLSKGSRFALHPSRCGPPAQSQLIRVGRGMRSRDSAPLSKMNPEYGVATHESRDAVSLPMSLEIWGRYSL